MTNAVYGGWLYQWHFENFGKESLLKQYNKSIKTSEEISEKLIVDIHEVNDGPWLMWLLTSMYTISQKANHQLQYLAFLSEWRGLSSRGREILGGVSAYTCTRTYDAFKRRIVDIYDAELQAILSDNIFVWWIDNYAHSIFRNIPTVDTTMFANNMWTAVAIFKSDAVVDMSIVGRPKHGFPRDVRDLIAEEGRLVDLLEDVHNHCSLEETLFVKYNISWLPIRPTRDYISRERLLRLYPVDIVKDNIGSQAGLSEMMKYVRNMISKRSHLRYSVGAVDTNIYWRLVKVHLLPHLSVICNHLNVLSV